MNTIKRFSLSSVLLLVISIHLEANTISTLEGYFDGHLRNSSVFLAECNAFNSYCSDQQIEVEAKVWTDYNVDGDGFTIRLIQLSATDITWKEFTNVRPNEHVCFKSFTIDPGEIPNGTYCIEVSCKFPGSATVHTKRTCEIELSTITCGLVEDALNWSAPKVLTNSSIATAEYKLYYVGDDRKIYNQYWDGDSWEHSVLNNSAPLAASVDIVAIANNVYYVGDDFKIKNLYWTGTGWSYTTLVSTQPSVRINSNLYYAENKIYFIAASNNKVYNLYYTGGSWYSSSLNNSAPSVRDNSRFVADIGKVYYVGAADEKIYNYYYSGGSWNYSILTTSSSDVLDDTGVDIEGGKIYYTGSDQKVRRQVWNAGTSTWNETVLNTSQIPVGTAEQLSVKSGRVYYGNAGGIYYLEVIGHAWQNLNLSPCTGPYSSYMYKTDAKFCIPESDQKIYYIGDDRRIHSYYYIPCRITNDSEINPIDDLTIFPNPASGSFSILNDMSNMDRAEITIFNLNGQLIYSQQISSQISQNEKIKIEANLLKGIYIVKLSDDKISKCGKIIVQ